MLHTCQMGLATSMVQAPQLPNDRPRRRLRIAMHRRSMSTNLLSELRQTLPTSLPKPRESCHRHPNGRLIRSLRLLVGLILPRQGSK